jgi:hypothetical protein
MTTPDEQQTARAIYRAMAHPHGGPEHEPTTVAGMVDAITKAAGGSSPRAAAMAGIAPRTWRYIKSGARQPSAANLARLRDTQRSVRVSETRKKFLHGDPGPRVVISARVTISNDTRNRKLHISGWPRASSTDPQDQHDGMMGRILDHWLKGDDAAAVAALKAPIEAGIGHSVTLDRVFAIRTFRTDSDAASYAQVPVTTTRTQESD